MQPKNEKYPNSSGMVNMPILRRYVAEEGRDAAAEERVVARVCADYPPRPELGWINTDHMRHRIRKLQGRKRERRLGALPEWQGPHLGEGERGDE